jgi:methylmalonyl-CoA/ethylmalonyl-CoA epimerase
MLAFSSFSYFILCQAADRLYEEVFMESALPHGGTVTQIGIIVRDVEKSAKALSGFFGMPVPQWHWTDGKPSTWREFLDRNGEGVHYIAFVVSGMRERTEKLESMGFPLVQKGESTGGRYAYFDTAAGLKTILELLENDARPGAQT